MRAAVLLLAFDYLGAAAARSGAFVNNPASLRTSAKPGYQADGASTHARRGTAVTEIRLVLDAARFIRPEWTLQVDGLEGCRDMLGAV